MLILRLPDYDYDIAHLDFDRQLLISIYCSINKEGGGVAIWITEDVSNSSEPVTLLWSGLVAQRFVVQVPKLNNSMQSMDNIGQPAQKHGTETAKYVLKQVT